MANVAALHSSLTHYTIVASHLTILLSMILEIPTGKISPKSCRAFLLKPPRDVSLVTQ